VFLIGFTSLICPIKFKIIDTFIKQWIISIEFSCAQIITQNQILSNFFIFLIFTSYFWHYKNEIKLFKRQKCELKQKMLSLNLYLPKNYSFLLFRNIYLIFFRDVGFIFWLFFRKKRQDFFLLSSKNSRALPFMRAIVTNEIPMILITNSFSFLSTRVGYAFPLQRLASGIMEISLRVRVRERARLPARCLYRLEEESGGSRG